MIGASLAVHVPDDIFSVFLPVVITIFIPLMFIRTCHLHFHKHPHWLQPIVGLIMGVWMALGGNGALIIPFLLMWLIGSAFRKSIFYTRALDFALNAFAVLGYFIFGVDLDPALAVTVFASALVGGYFGGHIVFHVKAHWLKIAITAMGVAMLAKASFF